MKTLLQATCRLRKKRALSSRKNKLLQGLGGRTGGIQPISASLQQAEYWSQIAAEQVSPLPKDCETEQRIVKDTSSVLCELTAEDTKHLLTDVHQPYGTEINDILLSALGLTMKEWTKGPKLALTLRDTAGRTLSRM